MTEHNDFDAFEKLQEELNPHRGEQLRAAMIETQDWLRRRGVKVGRKETPEELADLLSAIERFEIAVQANGGDLMIADDPRYALPTRRRLEPTRDYIARIDAARDALR